MIDSTTSTRTRAADSFWFANLNQRSAKEGVGGPVSASGGAYPINDIYSIRRQLDAWQDKTSARGSHFGRHSFVTFLQLNACLNFIHKVPPATAVTVQVVSDLQFAIEEAVLTEFAGVSQVRRIYSDRDQAEYTFEILVVGEQYNEELMDRLLEREYRLGSAYKAYTLSFRYVPFVSDQVLHHALRNTARLIFDEEALG